VIDYSSSARDVPSSTPTARCQTKRTPFFFPPLCFSRSRSRIRPRFHLPRGHRPWSMRVRGRGRTRFSPSSADERARRRCRVILQVHEASNRSHFRQTFSLRWRPYILFRPIYIRVRGEAYRQKCADIKNTFSKTCYRELAPRRFIQRINVVVSLLMLYSHSRRKFSFDQGKQR